MGTTNLVSADLNYKPAPSLLLAAQSSYDYSPGTELTESRWQAVGLRTEWLPTQWFQFRTLTTYDTTEEKVENVRLDLGYKPGATYVGIGSQYDGIRHTWGNASIFIDGLKWNRLKISVLLDYDGYLQQFDARHFSFTYDLHCAEAILQILDNPTGFNAGTQVIFMIRLKAFPFDTPFGTGQRGQQLGTGSGYNY
jgi:LPS-assembly protein